MKVHLIDGTYELFRFFFGAPEARAPNGAEVGATRGLLRSFAAFVREAPVTHAGVAFDTVIESFRNDLFAGYKTGEGLDAALVTQFPLAERACEALGLVVWRMIEFEADDALATAAAVAAGDARVEQVVICSPDKDLLQCVRGDRVVALDRMRARVTDEPGVAVKLGVPPSAVADYLALVGDSADGYPGIPRWGARSSSALLACYGALDAIPSDPAVWKVKVRGAAALAAELNARREEALLYRRLATLRTDVPLAEQTVDALAWNGAPRALLEPFCAEIGETQVLSRLEEAGLLR